MDLGLKGKSVLVLPNMILSNTIRAGVHALAKSLATELAGDGILVNTVAPGRIMTDRTAELDRIKAEKLGVPLETIQADLTAQIPLGRYGQPDEFGRAVAFLGSFANTYISGQTLLVDGGMIKSL
ncbi:SDR family oxidoreductase [Paenibacillus naphthalenovorans]|uniref:SDR family oxidoreductase n=1 Tax=Paenibacillus naphthalenovorans TaxID=162209 RepID=UPI003D2749A6